MDEITPEKIVEMLTGATQLARLEEAKGTVQLLTSIQRLVLYCSKGPIWVPMPEELNAVSDFIVIRKARLGNRIFVDSIDASNYFLKAGTILEPLFQECTLDKMLDNQNMKFRISFLKEDTGFQFKIISQFGSQTEIKSFPIEQ